MKFPLARLHQFPSGQYNPFAILKSRGDVFIQSLAVQIEKCQHPFVVLLSMMTLQILVFYKSRSSGASFCFFFPRDLVLAPFRSFHFGNNMRHGLGEFFVTPIMPFGAHW